MLHNRIWTDAAREIRKTLSRFLSLFLLSALAVAFLAGLRTTAPDMEHSADDYYDAHGLMDLRVLSTLGLTEEDVSVLAAQPGISGAEGAYSVDALLHLEENDLVVKLLSLSARGINTPELVEGRLPENDGECAVDPALLTSAGLSIGDSISFDTGEDAWKDALRSGSFTIVGTVHSPLYASFERGSASIGSGKVSAFALLPAGAFKLDYYTDAYLQADGLAPLRCYDDDYQVRIDALEEQLEPLSDQRAALRQDDVVGEANEKLSDAQKEFDEAQAEADRELAEGEQKLVDARGKLDDGWAEYRDGQATLARETADAQRKIADAERELPDALQTLNDGEADYLDGVGKLEDGRQEYAEGLQTWQDGLAAYNDGYQTLVDGEAEYADHLQTLRDAQQEYDDGRKNYQAGLAALADGAGQLDYARRQLEEAEEKLMVARSSLGLGQLQLGEGRQAYEAGLAAYQGAATAMGAVDSTMAALALDPASPDFTLGLAALAGNPDGQAALLNGAVLPLRGVLSALAAQAAGEEAAQLAALLQALPEDGDTLSYLLSDPEAGLPTLTMGLQYGIAAAQQGLAAMSQALDAAQSQLATGEAQLHAGASALYEGGVQYREGKQLYDENLVKFNDSVQALQEAGDTLADAGVELDDGWAKLAEGRATLDDGWDDLGDAKAELDDGELQLIISARTLESAERQLAAARTALDEGRQEYEDGLTALADAKRRLPQETAKAEKKLSDALVELDDGEGEYADGLQTYNDGKAEADEKLSDARKELNDARRKISEIEDCKWYILGRNTNVGYVSFQQDAERMGNLASVFPLIFFLVAALVCLTTMTRMVEEQRVQIGCLKALGYGKGAIALKYVGYGFLASFLGGVAGLLLGLTAIPWVIFNAWKIMYTVGELQYGFPLATSLGSVAAAVACVTLTALASSYAALSAVPADLMRPRTPKPGKRVLLERIPPVWRRLSFTWKVTMRNLFRYKKRFWMTVAGIGGCTALILTGFGTRNSIYDILDKQFDEISTYHTQVSLADDLTDDEWTEIGRVLDDPGRVAEWMPCYEGSLTAVGAKRSVDATLFAVEDREKFEAFIHLRHRLDSAPVMLPDEGVILTEKLATMLGVKPGDTITLDGDKRVEAKVVDTTENYVLHYIYLTEGYYRQLFGAAPTSNVVLTAYTEDTKEIADSVAGELISLSGVNSISRIRDTRSTLTKSMESVDYAVMLIIVCAAALAFVVLFNLTNINITERQRELATLKVLGFYDGELSAYVYRENVFLTLFGVGAGLFMGKYLHQWLVLTVEVDMVMFGRTARPSSYLLAVALTLLFSLLVNLAARGKLKKIDMVESLKTVD